jgi:hypothetical protein
VHLFFDAFANLILDYSELSTQANFEAGFLANFANRGLRQLLTRI